ncbi:hypothetical protein [Salinisphaera sp. T5B8]|uniref:hypothetical protein n=1 Tax=Salinisphaera sp. T5B8 TaxID=1304154 RepID=UPI00333F8BB9
MVIAIELLALSASSPLDMPMVSVEPAAIVGNALPPSVIVEPDTLLAKTMVSFASSPAAHVPTISFWFAAAIASRSVHWPAPLISAAESTVIVAAIAPGTTAASDVPTSATCTCRRNRPPVGLETVITYSPLQ